MATSGFNAVVSTFKDYIHSPTAKFDLNIEIYNAAAAQVTSKSEWAGQSGQSEAQIRFVFQVQVSAEPKVKRK